LASVDITRIRSFVDGSNIVLEMTLKGSVENDTQTAYWLHVGSQTASVGMYWANGLGYVYYYGGGGFDTLNITATGNVITGRLPQSKAGPENDFDIIGYAVHTVGSTYQFDWSGAGYIGGGGGNAGETVGIATWVLAILLIVPLIIVIAIVVILLTRRKKVPQQQPQYPPPSQYPPQYPQQYPPPPQYPPPQQPPQQNQPRPPDQ